MPHRRHVARAALTAAAATACLAVAAPGLALAAPLSQAPGGHNPPGDNGTVKIDGVPFSDKVDNQPHVTCDFELEFFNFDTNQAADITLTAQPPSGKGTVVWSVKNRIISTDPAGGAENDHDEVIRLSAKDLALGGLTAHPKQGYHLKLDVDLVDGKSSDAKHKVFWLQPCNTPSSPPPSSPPPSSPGDDGGDNGGGGGDNGGGGGTGGEGDGGSLPITGVAVTSTALGGLTLIAAGVALTWLRRRRDRITFTS